MINLSRLSFSLNTYKLLNKNLNFVPTQKRYDKKQLDQDLQNFYRLIKLKGYFKDSSEQQYEKNEATLFKQQNRNWTPHRNHHSIETFIDIVQKDIDKMKQENLIEVKHNLTKGEQLALDELSKRDDILITNADKGGAVVILDTEKYIKEAERQLNDIKNYKMLNTDPTLTYTKLINAAIARFKNENIIPENISKGLIANSPRIPKFYMLPKIHKKDNPGRPVVSSINCHTNQISRYIDYHLQPIVKQIPSYVKDTNDFIRKISAINLPQNSILVSMDVKSLYTNIPNAEGICAVKRSYDQYTKKTLPTKVIVTFLSLILTLNYFTFNSKFYLQTRGCAMGTICAPSYANIFMEHFEKTHIYPLIENKTKLYLRYIDDIIMIWTGSENELFNFLNDLNK